MKTRKDKRTAGWQMAMAAQNDTMETVLRAQRYSGEQKVHDEGRGKGRFAW